MLESRLQKIIINYIQDTYPDTLVIITDKMKGGISDLTLCHKGRFIAVELKVNHKQTTNQKVYQMRVENSGGIYSIIKSKEELKTLLDTI